MGHVDPPQVVAELDRIKRRHPTVVEHDVGEVQVAVALADAACGLPGGEHRRSGSEPALEPFFKAVGAIGGLRQQRANGREIDRRRCEHRIGRAPRVAETSHGQPVLHGSNRLAERSAVRHGQPPGLKPGVEPVILVELHELHRPLNRLTVAAHARRIAATGDGHGRQVELRREPAAHADLAVARSPPQLERGVVDESE